MTATILVVEDDQDLSEILMFNLQLFGYQATLAEDFDQAKYLISHHPYDLLLLDVMIPGGCGLQLCRYARQSQEQQNIIMLTSLSSENDRITGLEMGADDYLCKPFSLRELQARIKARLRRQGSADTLTFGDLTIDSSQHQAWACGEPIHLTVKEFELLHFLAKQPGKVFSRDELLAHIWGYRFEGYEHTVNTHINRLRKKLKPLDYVQTVWGVGYKLQTEMALC